MYFCLIARGLQPVDGRTEDGVLALDGELLPGVGRAIDGLDLVVLAVDGGINLAIG